MQDSLSDKSGLLRRKAEDLLRSKSTLLPKDFAKSLEELVESLQVYQFELEMQNEELVRVQQSLELTGSKYFNLFNSAPIAYCTVDAVGVITNVNNAFKDILLTPNIDAIGKNLSEFIDPDSQDEFYNHLRVTLNKRDKHISLMLFKGKHGVVYAKLHTQILHKDKDTPLVVLCALHDITHEILSKAKLEESEQRFQSLVDSIDDVVFTLNTNQEHTGVYGKWLERYNQTPSDYLGKTSAQLLGKENALIHEKHNLIALSGKSVVYNWSVKSLNDIQFFQTSLSPILNSNYEVVGIAGVARNITEIKLAEEAILERNKELYCLYTISKLGNDSNIDFDTYLQECVKIIPEGFTRPADTVVRIILPSKSYQTSSFSETPYKLSRDILINGELVGTISVYCLRADCVESKQHFGEDEKNFLQAIVAHISQVIKRNRDTDEISQQYVSLQRLNAEKDKLFSVIGHDLRGPLSTILGLSNLLETRHEILTQEKRLMMAKGISSTAKNVYQLLENLLEWARFQRGIMSFAPTKFLLSSIVKAVLNFYEEPIIHKGIAFVTSVPEHIYVFADNNMIQSVIRNLVSNALKFSFENSKVIISAHIDGNKVVVSISDFGMGMDQNILNNLFRIECNIGRQGTNNEPSSGLGLLLCKEFIDKHGGEIWAESTVGQGSTFYFTVPQSL